MLTTYSSSTYVRRRSNQIKNPCLFSDASNYYCTSDPRPDRERYVAVRFSFSFFFVRHIRPFATYIPLYLVEPVCPRTPKETKDLAFPIRV